MSFGENTQSLEQKRKTDVQAAENLILVENTMEETTKCDKIKPDMHFRK